MKPQQSGDEVQTTAEFSRRIWENLTGHSGRRWVGSPDPLNLWL